MLAKLRRSLRRRLAFAGLCVALTVVSSLTAPRPAINQAISKRTFPCQIS